MAKHPKFEEEWVVGLGIVRSHPEGILKRAAAKEVVNECSTPEDPVTLLQMENLLGAKARQGVLIRQVITRGVPTLFPVLPPDMPAQSSISFVSLKGETTLEDLDKDIETAKEMLLWLAARPNLTAFVKRHYGL